MAELKTLWVGDLDPQWDEAFLANAYSTGGTIVKTKIMKDGAAGADQVYGFVEFSTQYEAMVRDITPGPGRRTETLCVVAECAAGLEQSSHPRNHSTLQTELGSA